jgi:hypothetical protein
MKQKRTPPQDGAPVRSQTVFSFAGHETFVFRHGWLTKAVEAVGNDSRVFSNPEAIVLLGVGKNMVRSIRHWGLATSVLVEEPKTRGTSLRVSEFGDLLFGPAGVDRYLEDANTLWLIHWQLLSNVGRSTTWRWAFSQFPSNEFTRDGLVESLLGGVRRAGQEVPSEHSVRRDVDVFLRTYIANRATSADLLEDSLDCPLAELEIIDQLGSSGGPYRLVRGPKPTLNDYVFAFAVSDFWNRIAPDRESLSFTDLAYGESSPGAVFKLDENSLIERLERLETTTCGDLAYAETAGLKQLYRRKTGPAIAYLHQYCNVAAPASELAGV